MLLLLRVACVAALDGTTGDDPGDGRCLGRPGGAELHVEGLDLGLGFGQRGCETGGTSLEIIGLGRAFFELLLEADSFFGLLLLGSYFTLEGGYQMIGS